MNFWPDFIDVLQDGLLYPIRQIIIPVWGIYIIKLSLLGSLTLFGIGIMVCLFSKSLRKSFFRPITFGWVGGIHLIC